MFYFYQFQIEQLQTNVKSHVFKMQTILDHKYQQMSAPKSMSISIFNENV